jgi:hypothetical protein
MLVNRQLKLVAIYAENTLLTYRQSRSKSLQRLIQPYFASAAGISPAWPRKTVQSPPALCFHSLDSIGSMNSIDS